MYPCMCGVYACDWACMYVIAYMCDVFSFLCVACGSVCALARAWTCVGIFVCIAVCGGEDVEQALYIILCSV